MQGYRDRFNRAYFNWESTESRVRLVLRQLAHLRRECDAFAEGDMQIIQAEGDVLHYRRTGPTQMAEIIVNRSCRLISAEAFGKHTEVNPYGFTILVEDVPPAPAPVLEKQSVEEPGQTPPAKAAEPAKAPAQAKAESKPEAKAEKAPKVEVKAEPKANK